MERSIIVLRYQPDMNIEGERMGHDIITILDMDTLGHRLYQGAYFNNTTFQDHFCHPLSYDYSL